MAARESKQFGTNQRQEAIGGCTIAIAPTGQHFGDFASLHYSHSPPERVLGSHLSKKGRAMGPNRKKSLPVVEVTAVCVLRFRLPAYVTRWRRKSDCGIRINKGGPNDKAVRAPCKRSGGYMSVLDGSRRPAR